MKTLFEHLCEYADKNRISFAMPGHKGGRGLSDEFKRRLCELDVTELSDTENLHSPNGIITAAKKELSSVYQSRESYFLTGGSTEGVHIMLHSTIKGGKLLVNRTCHRSVINCCTLAGFEPVFIPQKTDENLLVPLPTDAETVEEILSSREDIDAVMITSPSYYGHIADIKTISRVCHKFAVPLIVDEAHGSHFAAKGMPDGAIQCGADMAVQSAHKTLNALNQAAFLHINSELIDCSKVRALTTMLGTTSPSYPIVASAQLAVRELSGDKWRSLAEYINEKKRILCADTNILFPIGETDPTRIVFGFKNYDITGYEAERILREKYNIDAEMSDRHNVVCIATAANTFEDIDSLFAAVWKICQNANDGAAAALPMPPWQKAAVSPRTAFLADGEVVPPEKAAGRISKANIAAYPPGIALVGFGEIITQEMIDYILKIKELGAAVEGMEKDGICVAAE